MTECFYWKYIVVFFLLLILIVLGMNYFSKAFYSPKLSSPWRLCDLDHNGSCNNIDMQIFDRAFGSCSGDSDYSFEADIDGDGCIVTADKDNFIKLLEE